MSKEKPLLGVLSAFNNLCLLIKEKCSSHELLEMAGRFVRDFESDYTVVAQLLPNMSVLFPELKAREDASGAKQTMNLHNVCFTLQRFLRIVSSRLRPVMLFLDDLQWAAAPTFELIQDLLTDTEVGSSCFFFVGSYRDNEVEKEHPIFSLMSSLESKDVELMKLSLGGLAREDVNQMISEMLTAGSSMSVSLAPTSMTTGVSSSVSAVSSPAVGGSLTAATMMATAMGAEACPPGVVRVKVRESVPA